MSYWNFGQYDMYMSLLNLILRNLFLCMIALLAWFGVARVWHSMCDSSHRVAATGTHPTSNHLSISYSLVGSNRCIAPIGRPPRRSDPAEGSGIRRRPLLPNT